jgi:hypothetical protein
VADDCWEHAENGLSEDGDVATAMNNAEVTLVRSTFGMWRWEPDWSCLKENPRTKLNLTSKINHLRFILSQEMAKRQYSNWRLRESCFENGKSDYMFLSWWERSSVGMRWRTCQRDIPVKRRGLTRKLCLIFLVV